MAFKFEKLNATLDFMMINPAETHHKINELVKDVD